MMIKLKVIIHKKMHVYSARDKAIYFILFYFFWLNFRLKGIMLDGEILCLICGIYR
jgi:hypothetical protein